MNLGEDALTLSVGGRVYEGWTEIRLSRAIDRMATDFELQVSERWAGQREPWPIKRFSPCAVFIGGDLAMTGYVDVIAPNYDAANHAVHITGRSMTEDLVDCATEIPGGQFKGYRLDAIARAVAKPFGIGVIVETDTGEPFPDATVERAETAFQFLERLCRLRGVLASDDERGNLVLTRAGARRGSGALVEGGNILAAGARLSAAKRFSKYIVRTQHGITADEEEVATEIVGEALDQSCPRYRPHVSMGESQLTLAQAQSRARWQAVYNTARSTEAEIVVQGWRQPDGRLWRVNEIVPVTSPWLQLDRDLLVAGVEYSLNGADGRRTRLRLGPVEGYTPDPGQVKIRRNRHGGADTWGDVRSIKGGAI